MNNIRDKADTEIKPINVTFQISPHHIDRDSTKWRAAPCHIKIQKRVRNGKMQDNIKDGRKTVDARRNKIHDSRRINPIRNQL